MIASCEKTLLNSSQGVSCCKRSRTYRAFGRGRLGGGVQELKRYQFYKCSQSVSFFFDAYRRGPAFYSVEKNTPERILRGAI